MGIGIIDLLQDAICNTLFEFVAQNGGDIVQVNGKYGFWATNKWGKKYFRELEKRGNSYYIKGTKQMHLPPAEYGIVMEHLKYENLSTEQIKSKRFTKEINGITYFVNNTDSGCIVRDRKDK